MLQATGLSVLPWAKPVAGVRGPGLRQCGGERGGLAAGAPGEPCLGPPSFPGTTRGRLQPQGFAGVRQNSFSFAVCSLHLGCQSQCAVGHPVGLVLANRGDLVSKIFERGITAARPPSCIEELMAKPFDEPELWSWF